MLSANIYDALIKNDWLEKLFLLNELRKAEEHSAQKSNI